jgi:hypothetical protein
MTEPAPIDSRSAPSDAEIVARPDNWYRGKRMLFAIALIAAGPWFWYDGWIKWPQENATAVELKASKQPHSDLDLLIQKVLACALPPLGIFWLSRILYTSRGAYRLRGEMLSVPGHPEVPIDAITRIDLQRWDRKGIAVLDYQHNGRAGRFKLDDFVYQRKPTDEILDRIKARIAPDEAAPAGEPSPTAAETGEA